MEFLFIFVSIPLLALGLLFGCIAGYTRARRKGYSPPAAALVLLAAAGVGALAVSAVLPHVVLGDQTALIFSVTCWLPVIVASAATVLMIRLLPRRNPTFSGPRKPRFPFRTAGWLLVGIGVAILIATIWTERPFDDAIKLLGILMGCGAGFIALGKRATSSPSVEAVAATDPRPPVLYLRDAMQEGFPFVVGKRSRYGRYLSEAQTDFAGEESDRTVTVRFEAYLCETIKARIGPFVTLGNPQDYIPPEGAVRTDAGGHHWRHHFSKLAAASSCIVAEAGLSKDMQWELQYLRQHGLQRKLFLMTPPETFRFNWFDRLYLQARQLRSITWDEFAAVMKASGYQVPGDPGPGCVLTFDQAGDGIVLAKGVAAPEEYIEPVRDALALSTGHSPEAFDPPPMSAAEPKPPTAPSRIMSPVVIIGLIFLGLLAAPQIPRLIRSSHDRTRAAALKDLAPQIGFTLQDTDAAVIDADLAATRLIDNRKNNGAASNAMEGTAAGLHAALFDYRYDEEPDHVAGEPAHPVVQTVAAFTSADRRLPRFLLQENSLKNSLDLTGEEASHHIEFADQPEFSKRFILIGDDTAATTRIFTPQLRGFLVNAYRGAKWRMEGAGPWLVLYQPGVQVQPKDWQSFVNQTSQTADSFFKTAGR